MRPLENCPDCNRELLAASPALVEASANALALERIDGLPAHAMRADRAVRPAPLFQVGAASVIGREAMYELEESAVNRAVNKSRFLFHDNFCAPSPRRK